ncbi:hypothetical protein GSQ33_04380 [Clostridioides difficile]|nr:hypothetical protein [Clostridioides difficile]HBF8833523.1 hypothetical protein [Clostridioides difficile]
MRAIKINTKNEIMSIEINDVLTDVKREIGGFERVKPVRLCCLDRKFVMFVDDEGYSKELDFNLAGSYLYKTDEHGHPILGNIVIMKEDFAGSGVKTFGLEESEIDLIVREIKQIL